MARRHIHGPPLPNHIHSFMSSPPLSCSPCSTPHSWLPSPRSHSQFYVISTSELSTLLDATVMTPQSPQTKLCRLNTTFTEVHRVEVAETLSGINQSLTRHSSQYGIANILFCNHADNPTLEVLAVVTAVDKISEPAALSAVLFLSIPDFVCFQRRPTPIGDSLGSYASGPKICHAGLGFNQPVFSHQILQSSDAEVNISSYLTFLPELPTYLTFLPDLPS